MANPNPEVWGAPDTWVNTNIMYTPNSYPAIKAGKAKVASFRNLYNGIAQGKFNYGVDPIDNTVCPVGQDPAVSCFGKMYVVGVNSIPSTDVLNPEVTNEFEAPVNWCFTENGPGTQGWVIRNYYTSSYKDTASSARWLPNTGTINTDANRNAGVCPFTYYQLKSLLLSIKVLLIDGYSDNYYGNMPYSQSGTWISLADWKANYPNRKAFRIKFDINSVDNADPNTITYQNYDTTFGNFDTLSVALLDGFELNKNDSTVFYDYATFQIEAKSRSFYLVNDINGNDDVYVRHILMSIDKFENATIRTTKGTSNDHVYCAWQEVPYTEKNYETIMKMVACFGVPFTDTDKLTFKLDFTDNELCLPVIDENGVSHGEYTRGTANTTNDIYNADSVRDKNYDPTKPPKPTDPNTYSITTGFNTVGAVASTTKAYVVNGAALVGLSGELWSIVGKLVTNPEDMGNLENLALDAFLTHNPIDAIVSVKKFPLLNIPHGENLINVKLGKYTTSAGGYDLAMQQSRYNFTGIPIFPKFGNCFLDYSPYTKMQLYVPFCGTIDIDAADFMGRTLSVEMCIDFTTGAVTAYVLANQLVVTSLTGNCAVDIPITGTEQATVNSALQSATIAERQARHKTIMTNWGVVTHPIKTITSPLKTLSSTIDPALNLAQREYELTHINTPLRQIGQASPLNAWELEFVCRLIIYYPDGECIQFNATNEPRLIDAKVQAFGAVNGFATVETDTLSNFTGFTQVSDVDLTGISATDTEKGMILNLLQTGVYL